MAKATGQKRGFAFVTFEESAPVDKCIGVAAQLVLVNPIELSSFNLELRSHMVNEHRCDVKKAKSREELKLEEQKRDRRGRDMRTRGGINGGLACVSGGWSSGWNQGEKKINSKKAQQANAIIISGQSWNDNGYGGGGYGGISPIL